MNVEPIIFFDMVTTIFVLSLALMAIVFYLSHIVKRIHEGKEALGDESMKKGSDLLNQTRQKAIEIIDDANNKALDIVEKANLSTDIASTNFSREVTRISSLQIKEFEKATMDFMKLYAQVLQDLKSKNIEVFQSVSKDIEGNTMEEVKNFKNTMEQLTLTSQETVRKKINEDYDIARKAIEDYKTQGMKKIDDKIYELLEKVSKLVLGKAMNLSEHEDLILKSLEKAKKEGVFEQ